MTAQQRQVNLFRFVPGTSPVHRMWAGTKIACMAALGLVLFIKPTWGPLAIVAGVIVIYAIAARIPIGVTANPPRWIFIAAAVSGFFSSIAFGPPVVHVAHFGIGLGGLIYFLRVTAFTIDLLALGLLLGWTTPLADVAAAFHRLSVPLRFVRLPIDEIVVAIGLSVRCLPLLADDIRTLQAAWRVRAPVRKLKVNERIQEVRDLLIAALVSSLRRAREMGEAIDARGGPHGAPRDRVRVGLPDLVALAVTITAVTVAMRL